MARGSLQWCGSCASVRTLHVETTPLIPGPALDDQRGATHEIQVAEQTSCIRTRSALSRARVRATGAPAGVGAHRPRLLCRRPAQVEAGGRVCRLGARVVNVQRGPGCICIGTRRAWICLSTQHSGRHHPPHPYSVALPPQRFASRVDDGRGVPCVVLLRLHRHRPCLVTRDRRIAGHM